MIHTNPVKSQKWSTQQDISLDVGGVPSRQLGTSTSSSIATDPSQASSRFTQSTLEVAEKSAVIEVPPLPAALPIRARDVWNTQVRNMTEMVDPDARDAEVRSMAFNIIYRTEITNVFQTYSRSTVDGIISKAADIARVNPGFGEWLPKFNDLSSRPVRNQHAMVFAFIEAFERGELETGEGRQLLTAFTQSLIDWDRPAFLNDGMKKLIAVRRENPDVRAAVDALVAKYLETVGKPGDHGAAAVGFGKALWAATGEPDHVNYK